MTYPSELDTDDTEELASYIERRYPTEEIRIHDTGVATVPRGATRRAWMECRKHDLAENETKRDVVTVSCPSCEEEYTPDNARTIAIFGPGDIRYTCPRCGHGTTVHHRFSMKNSLL
jgi:GTP cyclohydrolase III